MMKENSMMLKPDFSEFCRLSREFNVVPVFREFLADMETPVSVLSRFSEDENVFLLESVEGGERVGRYSFIGVNPRGIFRVENGKAYFADSCGEREIPPEEESPFLALRRLLKDVRTASVPGLPPLFGGAVGYLGYETVREFEKLPPPRNSTGTQCAFLLTDEMIIFDNLRHSILLSVCIHTEEFDSLRSAYQHAEKRISALRSALEERGGKREPLTGVKFPQPGLRPNMAKEEYCAMVEKAREHIVNGDVIQVVLAQKFSAETQIPPLTLYRALRLINPSPYTFFLKTGRRILCGSSPETLAKFDNGYAMLSPIAGTRKRGQTHAEDIRLADELLRDEKERAEHLMLVDLGRNDLGRIAAPGSVQVKSFMNVERYSHVMHLVSHLEALPEEGRDAFDLVRSAFPAGTLSGAPKIRAMEIIRDLEPEARGVYGGAAGYFSYTGSMDLAIIIRTMLIENGKLSIQAGAGIVYDSDPEKEYEETLNKAAAMTRAVNLAANGLEVF